MVTKIKVFYPVASVAFVDALNICFLHKMLRSDNSIVASVMKFFIHFDEYVKLCDYADTTPRDNINTIKRQINLKFIAECNL